MRSAAIPRNPYTSRSPSTCINRHHAVFEFVTFSLFSPLFVSAMKFTRPEGSTSPSFSHQRTEVVALPSYMPWILHTKARSGRFHEGRGLSPSRDRQNCSFRVSPGTTTSVFQKLPNNSLPDHRQRRWNCSTGGGPGAETLLPLDSGNRTRSALRSLWARRQAVRSVCSRLTLSTDTMCFFGSSVPRIRDLRGI